MSHSRTRIAVVLLLFFATAAQAQTLRGSVADERDAPVPGVVVQLLDAQSAIVARALSNERGEYRLTAPGEGTYRVRTQRIGFRPVSYGPFTLRSDEELAQRLVLTGLPVRLSTVSVVGQSPCRSLGDQTSATYLVWEQVRTALSAAQLTANAEGIASTMLLHDRILNLRRDSVLQERITIHAEDMTKPWRSMSADSLRQLGYVVTDDYGATTYHAPDLDVLLSDVFLEDHCFRIVPSPDPKLIGIAFEPIPARRRVSEIRGTLWVDLLSSELRRMEYRYANTERDLAEHAGGTQEFVRMANGAWVISDWEIRMPLLQVRRVTIQLGGRSRPPRRANVDVVGVKASGGQLALIRQGADTLWSQPPTTLIATVTDSASREPIAGARVSLSGTPREAVSDAAGRAALEAMLPGVYTVEVRTASLDSIGVVYDSPLNYIGAAGTIAFAVPSASQVSAMLCSSDPAMHVAGVPRGIVAGRIRGSPASIRNAHVMAEWVETPAVADSLSEGPQARSIETRSDARGMFRLCGVPIGVDVVIRAAGDGGISPPLPAIIPEGRGYAWVPVTLDSVPPPGDGDEQGAVGNRARR